MKCPHCGEQISESRTYETQRPAIKVGRIKAIPEEVVIYLGKRRVAFSKMEFEIIYRMLRTPKKVFQRYELLDEISGEMNVSGNRTIDTHIKRIRAKAGYRIIETVRGVGYKLAEGD